MRKITTFYLLMNIVFISNGQSSFGETEAMPLALKGDIYFIQETESLPNFDSLQKEGTIYTEELDIAPRDFKEGFPGITDRFEWFAIRYTGEFNLNFTGNFLFELGSDDGSKLFIDNKLVINNDGLHAPTVMNKEIFLEKGKHSLEVRYFQGPKFEIALGLYFAYEQNPLMPFSIERLENLQPTMNPASFKKIVVNFDYDEYETKEDISLPLKNMFRLLESNKEYKFKISGYTDSKGSEKYNYELAEKRIKFIEQKIYNIVSTSEIQDKIILNPIGETSIEKNENEAAENRKVVIEIIKG